MTYDEFNEFCGSLKATTHVIQWGGSHVWKVGGKVFAVGGWDDGNQPHITFKVSKIAYEFLKEQDGLRPAPYLASRGMSWIQYCSDRAFSDEELLEYIRSSYNLVIAGLTKKKRKELGLDEL